jgi:hypothetical protein
MCLKASVSLEFTAGAGKVGPIKDAANPRFKGNLDRVTAEVGGAIEAASRSTQKPPNAQRDCLRRPLSPPGTSNRIADFPPSCEGKYGRKIARIRQHAGYVPDCTSVLHDERPILIAHCQDCKA